MTLTQSVYNLIDQSSEITIPEYAAGVVPSDISAKEGLLTFFPLPSPGANFASNTSVTQFQFDIWHAQMYKAEEYKEEIITALHGTAGLQDGRALIISMDSDLGGVYDDSGEIWHYMVVLNIKYNKRVP